MWGRAWGVALAGLLLASGAYSDETRLSPDAAQTLAVRAITQGNPQEALVLIDGVLLARPDRISALLLKSRVLRDLGRAPEARKIARDAFVKAPTREDRYLAAMMLAQARYAEGDKGLAQVWLRRAAQMAPDARLKAQAIQHFRQVRSRTPWRLNLDIFAIPSDNLNNAPKVGTSTFSVGTVQNPRPREGFRYGGEAQLTYYLPTGDRSRANVTAAGLLSRVTFTDDGEGSDLTEGDLRYDRLRFGLGWETRSAAQDWIFRAQIENARAWFGGALYSDTRELRLTYDRALMEGLKGGVYTRFIREDRHDASIRDNDTWVLGGSLSYTLQQHGTLSLGLDWSETTSESSRVARLERGATLRYRFAQKLGPVLPELSLRYETIDYTSADRPYFSDARQDQEWTVSIDLLLPHADIYGFAPEVGLSYSDRSSNYEEWYGSARTDLRLGLKSVF